MSNGLEDFSLFDLFRMEAEEQVRVLQSELLAVESGNTTAASLEALMRASHSLKGAARIVGLDTIVHLTHAMEDRFVAAQSGKTLDAADIDRMLAATDWLARLQAVPEAETASWLEQNTPAIEDCAAKFREAEQGVAESDTAEPVPEPIAELQEPQAPEPSPTPEHQLAPPVPVAPTNKESGIFAQHTQDEAARRERIVRLDTTRFDSLLAMSAETLVAAHQLSAWGEALTRSHQAVTRSLQLAEDAADPAVRAEAQRELDAQLAILGEHIADIEQVSRTNEHTAERLHRIALSGRLRPFSEGIPNLARLVRDTARDLGKSVRLELVGENTRVDKDVLDRMETAITHLVTNAIDHGIETLPERVASGKPTEAKLRVHARHESGRLVITVRDDGRGIDPERVRRRIVERSLISYENAAQLSEEEVLEFLFLPGFSTRDDVTLHSGRGVGLDAVQAMVQAAGGAVTVSSELGQGTVFRMTLPITRSTARSLRVVVSGETYAIALYRIERVAQMTPVQLTPEGEPSKPIVNIDGQTYPVIDLAPLLGLPERPLPPGEINLVFWGGHAFVVDQLLDQVELTVRYLEGRFGKIPGIIAASIDENGLPLLFLNTEDLTQRISGAAVTTVATENTAAPHILVVDDSHTVREMERRLLARAGYTVTTAQNGQEAWNLLRMNDYELLISDVDMPQMNGIELVSRVRENPRLARVPVIILSYKDREEDRRRGLDAGADFYLTKGDFQNGIFLQAVVDLVGHANQFRPDAENEPGDAA